MKNLTIIILFLILGCNSEPLTLEEELIIKIHRMAWFDGARAAMNAEDFNAHVAAKKYKKDSIELIELLGIDK